MESQRRDRPGAPVPAQATAVKTARALAYSTRPSVPHHNFLDIPALYRRRPSSWRRLSECKCGIGIHCTSEEKNASARILQTPEANTHERQTRFWRFVSSVVRAARY